MLYQQSLSGAFQSMADVFSGLMAAVGAADKVLELMNRTPEVRKGCVRVCVASDTQRCRDWGLHVSGENCPDPHSQ